MSTSYTLRPATQNDRGGISDLVEAAYHVHRHLDWRPPVDWLGHQPFWLLERNGKIQSALACPAELPETSWIRFFATLSTHKPLVEWNILFEATKKEMADMPAVCLASLSLTPWYASMLGDSGFSHHQDIVVLEWNGKIPPTRPLNTKIQIRQMALGDLPKVLEIDNISFENIWQNSRIEIHQAYLQSTYSTVVEYEEQIIGFQISTSSPFNAHLARLAVLPEWRRKSIGYALVNNLIKFIRQTGLPRITVNTQSDNLGSLALYQQLGFILTGEAFPVFIMPLK
jgi:ribosomal-protein-alanine N-acetyltransferase